MNKNKAIAMAIEAIRRFASEHYGWSAKYHPDQKIKWDKWMDAIKVLEELRDGK